MNRKIAAMLLAACIILGCLAGCGSTAQKPEETQPAADEVQTEAPQSGQPEEPEQTAEVEEKLPEEHKVIDSGGTEVTVPAEVKTVMTFGSCGVINTLIETLGCGSLIANNMSPHFADSPKWHYQYDFAPQMKDAPQYENASGEIDIENLIVADPDLCIVMQEGTAESLRNAGLNVLYIDYGNGKTSEAVTNAMTILGDALGVPEKAEEYRLYIDEMVKKIADVTSSLKDEDKKSVLYGNISSFTNPHILIEWVIAAAGGISCTADIHEKGSVSFTAEDVLRWDPDVIMMITDNSQELKADPQLAGVKAVAEDQLYVFPTVGHFITGSSEAPLGILWLTHHLYPELYTYDELAQDIYYFYDTFFGYQMSDSEIEAIINNNEQSRQAAA